MKAGSPFTPAEDAMIHQFGSEGFVGIHARMPWRSERGIKDRAAVIGANVRHGIAVKTIDRPIPQNAPPLIKRMYQEMKDNKLHPDSVAKRAGVHRQSLREWLHRSPRLDLFLAVLNAMDLDLAIVHRAEDA